MSINKEIDSRDTGRPCDAVTGPPSGSDSSLPPSTNRGVSITVHWISITFFVNPAKAMTHLLNELLNGDIESEMDWSEYFYNHNHGARAYQALYSGPEGITLYAYPHTGVHCHVEIKGNLLDILGMDKLYHYLKSLNEQDYEWRAARVDIAFDNVPFTPMMCYESWQKGDIRTRIHKTSYKWLENSEGSTFYMGKKGSQRYIRIYDRRGPTRLEVEFREKWADQVALQLSESLVDKLSGYCIGIIRDSIDFVDTQNNSTNITRAELIEWWREFVGNFNKIKLNIHKTPAPPLAPKLLRTLDRWSLTLFVLRHGLNIDLNHYVDKFELKLKPEHKRRIEQLKSDG